MPTADTDPIPSTSIDRLELSDLVSRLGRWLDDGAAGDPAALFTEDATASTPGGRANGRDALVAQAQRNHDVPTQHLITNVLSDIDGDRATITANLLVTFFDDPASPGTTQSHGEGYKFSARRTNEGWRLSSVSVRPLWSDAA